MSISVHLVKKISEVESPLRDILILILEEIERQGKQQEEAVTKVEFNEVKEILKELAEAQKKSEEQISRLAKAQEKTEQAQKKTEERLSSLTERVEQLAEAQKKTEKRLNDLAKAQEKTEQRLNELAKAQEKTEREISRLTKEVREIKKHVGGLSVVVGYSLEDTLMDYIPQFVKKEMGILCESAERRNIIYPSGRYDEVNILAKGTNKDGGDIYLIGECKAQPGKKDVNVLQIW